MQVVDFQDKFDLSILGKFKELVERKNSKVAIFTHPYPDPDALGSMMGLKFLFAKLGINSDLFFSGTISHPQNRSMVNLLDPELHPLESYSAENYSLNIAVDCIPENAAKPEEKFKFDIVIDHHKESPKNFDGLYINFKAGSASATVFSIIEYMGLELDEEHDFRVATAMMIGITTDTEFLMSDDCSYYEFNAWSKLFFYRDPILLKQIINFERPKFWTESKATACSNATIEDSVGVVGMGIIPSKHRDMIADMADEMVTWEDINTAIVFAIVDGDRVEGSVRTKASSLSVPALCQELGGKHGKGGGKLGKGAYNYELAGVSLDKKEIL